MSAHLNHAPDTPDQPQQLEVQPSIAIITAAGTILDAAGRNPQLPFGKYSISAVEPGVFVTLETEKKDPYYARSESLTIRRLVPDESAYGIELVREGPVEDGYHVVNIDAVITAKDHIIKGVERIYERPFMGDHLLETITLDVTVADLVEHVQDPASNMGQELGGRSGWLKRLMGRILNG